MVRRNLAARRGRVLSFLMWSGLTVETTPPCDPAAGCARTPRDILACKRGGRAYLVGHTPSPDARTGR